MPTKERLAYAAYYDRVDNQNRGHERQLTVLAEFASLLTLDRLSPQQAERIAALAGIGRLMNATKVANALELVNIAKTLGVEPATIPADLRDYVVQECKVYGAPAPNFSADQPIPSLAWWAKASTQGDGEAPHR
jgi:hypothetical protein